VEVQRGDGTLIILRLPVKFEICPSGKAAAEAAQVQSALHCYVGDGQHASLMPCVSGMSDAAAKSTTRALVVLKKEDIEAARKHVESGVLECPQILEHAVKHYLTLTTEQRKEAHRIHVLSCANHAINLVAEARHKKSEKGALEAAMVMDRAATNISCWWAKKCAWKRCYLVPLKPEEAALQTNDLQQRPQSWWEVRSLLAVLEIVRLKKRNLWSKGHEGAGFTYVDRKTVKGWQLSVPGKHLDGESVQLDAWSTCLTCGVIKQTTTSTAAVRSSPSNAVRKGSTIASKSCCLLPKEAGCSSRCSCLLRCARTFLCGWRS